MLGGIAARDNLTLDGRDELVLVGRHDGSPVAIILYPGDADLSEVTSVEVPLDFEPVDIAIARWGESTGFAVLLGPGGELAGIDENGALVDLPLDESGLETTRAFSRMSVLGGPDHRLILADAVDVTVSDPLGGGELGVQSIPIVAVTTASEPVLLSGSSAWGTSVIGVVESDREIDVYPLTLDSGPVVGPDRVLDDFIPDALERPMWLQSGPYMVLVGIDPVGPALYYHSASLDTALNDSDRLFEGDFDVLHDLLTTRLNGGVRELILLVESFAVPQVLVFLDPIEGAPDDLPPALAFPLSGLEPPYWLQAMDAVADEGGPGLNEIIAYDHVGHLVCVDLVGSELQSCGALDLAGLTATGASTSGRPGW